MKPEQISTSDGTRVRYILCPVGAFPTDDGPELFPEGALGRCAEAERQEWTCTILCSTN